MNENELTGLLESLRRMGSDDLNVEVKESATTLSRDVWETVSAFANTAGGIIVLGVSERAGFVPVENFETEKVLNQFVAGMGDAGGRGKLANPPKYTIERVELQGTVVLVITIEELDPSSKPCYVIERGAQGGSYKRIDDKDVPSRRPRSCPCHRMSGRAPVIAMQCPARSQAILTRPWSTAR